MGLVCAGLRGRADFASARCTPLLSPATAFLTTLPLRAHILFATRARASPRSLLRALSRSKMLASPLLPSPRFAEETAYKPAKDLEAFNKLLPPPIEFVEGSSSGILAAAEGKYTPINEGPKPAASPVAVSVHVPPAPSFSLQRAPPRPLSPRNAPLCPPRSNLSCLRRLQNSCPSVRSRRTGPRARQSVADSTILAIPASSTAHYNVCCILRHYFTSFSTILRHYSLVSIVLFTNHLPTAHIYIWLRSELEGVVLHDLRATACHGRNTYEKAFDNAIPDRDEA